MKRRVLSYGLALSLILGAAAATSCTSSGNGTTASSTPNGNMFHSSFRSKPTIERHESGARVNPMILSHSNSKNTRVVIDVADQRGYLLVDGKIAIDTPVSTARPGKWTPRGSFNISQKVRTGKISTIYGVEMPYWMRLSGSASGMHAGPLPGYPASAGCIRMPPSSAQMIFDNTTYGTRVNIYSNWGGA